MNGIQFNKFFYLLERLVPPAAGFVVCDSKGKVTASHGQPPGVSLGSYLYTERPDTSAGVHPPPNVNILTTAEGRLLIRRDIISSADKPVGALFAFMDAEISQEDCCELDSYVAAIDATASCIAEECELTYELDMMSMELETRYEELNLVYETNDDVVEYRQETDTIQQLLSNCVEYMDVGLVALISSDQDKIHYAVSEKEPVRDPYPLVRDFSKDLHERMLNDSECLIFNKMPDPKRAALSLDIPYKVLTCPVLNSQGVAIASLVCLNQLHRADFFNSDKNLLDVMSRKVSKIIQANHDSLTGLINLRAFTHVLQDAIRSSYKKGVSYICLNVDLDQLGIINDNQGRAAGDDAIKSVAVLLKSRLRTIDTISYLGEGRFGIILEVCTLEQGMKVADNLCSAVVETPFHYKKEEVELSISIGMTQIGPNTSSPDAVLEAAELARNAAKRAGRNQVMVYNNDSSELSQRKEQMQWVGRIQKAMREDRFQIFCQEIRPIESIDEMYHFEVLVRMCDEDGNIVPPGNFVPTAEAYNLMPALDRWVIDHAFETLKDCGLAQHRGEGMVSINLSGKSLADEGLVDFIGEMFSKHRLLPDCICFEITETAAFGNMDSAKSVIDQVKTMGCHFSLDDFGTGLSSFSYLKELPVDYLKIDGSFVRTIHEDIITHTMVSSINQIGQVMGLKTIAEFVENDAIAQKLKEIGVDFMQGYSIGKPVLMRDYIETLRLTVLSRAV